MKPNNPYNRALSDVTDYVNRRAQAVHAEIDDNIENDGCIVQFNRLCGIRDLLSDISLKLLQLEQPESK